MPWTPPKPSTYVYKTVKGVEISIDLYPPTSKTSGPAPVVVWFHPGGWVDGSKEDIPAAQVYSAITRGWAFASVDYRLAPQVKLKDQLEDAKDAVAWVANGGFGKEVDAKKIVVSGSSAGGLLAFFAAHEGPVQPLATFAVYPGADLTLPSFNEKVAFPKPIAYDDVKEYLDPDGPVLAGSPGKVDFTTFTPLGRTKAAFYLSQEAAMEKYVVGPDDSPAKYDSRKVLKPWSRVVLIHGTDDKMVPLQVSKNIDKALADSKNAHLLIEVPGADHGFDLLIDAEDAQARKPFDEAFEWLEQFL